MKEVIFVGLPGPTHNYGGLSIDNLASSSHRGATSNPQEAALQALALARLLLTLGVNVAILPPQLRPHLGLLRTKFSGSDDEVIRLAAKENPDLLESASSSSAMWTANAATIAPAVDATDGKLHITVANLQTNPHRRIEAPDTLRVLQAIFTGAPNTIVHAPLPAQLRDEGAANHTRLAPRHDAKGLHLFAYGTDGNPNDPRTARQMLTASQAIAQQHALPDNQLMFLKQHPEAIKAGVFHNDVISVGNERLLLAHEFAYEDPSVFERIQAAYRALHPDQPPVHIVRIANADLSLQEAVQTYFFNSQLITRADGRMVMIAPLEVKLRFEGKAVRLIEAMLADSANPITEVHYVDLRQSMNNGGGPACLRLRVAMNDAQLEAIKKRTNVLVQEPLLQGLEQVIRAHYPSALEGAQLAQPELYQRCQLVLAQLGAVMQLPLLV
ncbi:MAG: N-succinylarginine dihydrolase [Rickettsiales bacterium]|nr:N-succinylarginine dihydrolase [Rickettsiales bacterium]